MSETISISVVEDNPSYAQAIQDVISASPGMQCVSTHRNATECEQAFRSKPSPHADIILLDLRLPDRNGMDLIPMLKECSPNTGIVILTSNDDYRVVLKAIQLGVLGYVLKDAPIADLRRAIVECHKGGCVIDPQLSRYVLKALSTDSDIADGESDSPLTERERQVLELMALGHVKKEVADELGISYSAVALYTANIYQKLQVPNIAAAVASAIRKGII